MIKFVLFLYFLLAGVTWVVGEAGVGVLGRLTVSDPVMVLLICTVLIRYGSRLRIPLVGRAALVMVVFFAPGVMSSAEPWTSILNWGIHAFAVIGFLALYNLIAVRPFEDRLEIARLWIRAAGILAALACYELIAPLIDLPGIATSLGQVSLARGGAVGTFRNTGQAGIFFVTGLACAVPLSQVLTGRARQEAMFWAIVLAVGTVLTVKRSALIAMGVGLLLILLWDRSWRGKARMLLLVGTCVVVILPTYTWLYESSEAFRWRIERKMHTTATALDEESFFSDNIRSGLQAFAAQPLVGVGLGGAAGVYTEKYEIHSTYVSVLAETGLVGVLGYLGFVLLLFRRTVFPLHCHPRAKRFLHLFAPMLIALFIAYAYTNHLRKREFWITIAVVSALVAPDVVRRRTSVDSLSPSRPRITDPFPAGSTTG